MTLEPLSLKGPIAVSVENVSKKYRLFSRPGDRLKEALHLFKKKYHREFWALRNVQFKISRGETVGIIGPNGSGKSTLLQIVCGVLKPTLGSVQAAGRVASLLELGVGFNPEFSGRQNALLNGALMGFSPAEMKARLPEIQAFADIGEFFDQPLRTYSSGMFVRLAFAAAIHVDPDILVIDEVLAVGDASFQHKCYRKLHQFQESGKSVLLVTHDMLAVTKLCDSAYLLDQGTIVREGKPAEVVHSYHELILTGRLGRGKRTPPGTQTDRQPGPDDPPEPVTLELGRFLKDIPATDQCPKRKGYNRYEHRYGDRRGEIIDYLMIVRDQGNVKTFLSGDWVDIYVKYRFYEEVKMPLYGFSIKTIEGIPIYGTNTRFINMTLSAGKKNSAVNFKFSIQINLNAGDYFLDLGLGEKLPAKDSPLDVREGLIHFWIEPRRRFDGFVEMATDLGEVSSAAAEVSVLNKV